MKHHNWQRVSIIIFMIWTIGADPQARADETPHIVFVTKYVRGLAANEDARIKAEKDIRDTATANDKLSSAVYGSTLIQLELQSQIQTLKDMHLNPPFDQLIPTIVELYQEKIALLQKMIDASSALLAGPKPDVDYSTLVSDLPKVRALLDDIDHSLFKFTPMVFATLIDSRPDSANHVNHLIIKKEQREELLNDLKIDFGEKLEQKNQNYIVGSASVLKGYLLKDYKCSDEPWQ